MTLVRRNQNWLPSVFNDLFDNEFMVRANSTAPAINVKENKDAYAVEVAAPGMTKKDFCVRIDEDNNLVISLEKHEEHKDEKDVLYLRREFAYSKVEQTMILPDDVDKEKIAATMENGVLEITLPKLSEKEIKKAQRMIEIA